MRITVVFILFLTLSFASCSDHTVYDWFVYPETLCANPWESNSNSDDAIIIDAVENYLSNLDIETEIVQVAGEHDFITCQACSCLSGREIRIKADKNAATTLLNIGFNYE